MSIWVNKDTKVVVQGLTGTEGRFHAEKCRDYGTQIVAGVTPGKAGQEVDGVPVFNTVEDAVAKTGADTSLVFVPPPFAADATLMRDVQVNRHPWDPLAQLRPSIPHNNSHFRHKTT